MYSGVSWFSDFVEVETSRSITNLITGEVGEVNVVVIFFFFLLVTRRTGQCPSAIRVAGIECQPGQELNFACVIREKGAEGPFQKEHEREKIKGIRGKRKE